MKEFIDKIIGRDLLSKLMEEEPAGGNLIICFKYLGLMTIDDNGRLCKTENLSSESERLADALYNFTGFKFPAYEVKKTIERFTEVGLIEKDHDGFLVISSLEE